MALTGNGRATAYSALVNNLRAHQPTDCAERDLWLAVIVQAAWDAFLSCATNRDEGEWQRHAREWFLHDDFDRVCHLAGLDPPWTRDQLSAFARYVMGEVQIRQQAIVRRRLEARRRATLASRLTQLGEHIIAT